MEIVQQFCEDKALSELQFSHIFFREGDTLVIIDFPAVTSFRNPVSCCAARWGKMDFRIDSKKLIRSGSSVLANLLSDSMQRRFLRRHGLTRETLPENVRYVVDLTPPSEGEESAFLVADLYLPSAVVDWWMAKDRLGVSWYLVCGHDDKCNDHGKVVNDCAKVAGWVSAARPEAEDTESGDPNIYRIPLELPEIELSPTRQIEHYCPIRHRVAIIRLLLHVKGEHLVLNSAPRVYTAVGVAKALDLTRTISSSVRAWLEDGRNSSFVDINPEIAMKMAWDLQLSDVVRTAMRIIVVERALEGGTKVGRTTLFGRPRGDLPDDINNVIEHATDNLRTRVKEAANALCHTGAYDWLKVPAWQILKQIGDSLPTIFSFPALQQTAYQLQSLRRHYKKIVACLLEYINKAVLGSLKAVPHPERVKIIDNNRLAFLQRGYASLAGATITDIIGSMSNEQRLLTRAFWARLKEETGDFKSFRNYCTEPYFSLRQDGADLDQFIDEVNSALANGLLPHLNAQFPTGISINAAKFHNQLAKSVQKSFDAWAPWDNQLEFRIMRTEHLALGLSEDEMKFLPLWAGGLDDGSGGVFDETTIPDTDMGAIGPGPSYVTGKTVAPSTTAASAMTIVGGASLQAVQSGTSMSNTDSYVQVSKASSAGWSKSSDFSLRNKIDAWTLAEEDSLDNSDGNNTPTEGASDYEMEATTNDPVGSFSDQELNLQDDSDTMDGLDIEENGSSDNATSNRTSPDAESEFDDWEDIYN
ncbi:hypothetical protein JX266_002885 [Neoarthrinium moseri]|nr:hypothetical protein JX266_002885 [Neoarthrinium moseri]